MDYNFFMNLAIITLTKKATKKGKDIKSLLSSTDNFNKLDIYSLIKYSDNETIKMNKGFKETISEIFNKYDAIYFIMASGIVVRTIVPLLKSKDIDPAIIVSDEDGKFIISLLSGHLGGANELSYMIADKIGGVPVISTASDVSGSIAVDSIAMKLKSHLLDLESAKDVTALIVNGENVDLKLPRNLRINSEKENNNGVIVVSNRLDIKLTQIIPENIIIGIGCRRDSPKKTILEAIEKTMEDANLHIKSIKHIATVDIKADEVGLLAVAKELKKNLIIIERDKIKAIQHNYKGSDFVEKTIGVRCVSAPVAYLSSSKKGKFIIEKRKFNGVTVSIYEDKNIKYKI